MIRRAFTQTLGPARLNYPPRRIVAKTSPIGGFGTVDLGRFNRAPTGTLPYVSAFRAPPAIRTGTRGISVVTSPGNDYTQQLIKKQTISLTNLFTDVQYNLAGTILWYMTSTNLTDQLQIRISDINADQLPWGPGNGIEGLSFSRVFISNLVAVPGAVATLVYFSDTPNAPARFF